jgi:ADP-ribose pyrophosphatase YjhB (NUDIX family)
VSGRSKSCSVHRLVADVAIVADGRVLLTRYEDTRPYDGQKGWFLPDDYLAHLEHPSDAARRIARDQAGLDLGSPPLGLVESFGDGRWHLVFHHVARLDVTPGVSAGTNVKDLEWFDLVDLPPDDDLAHHGWAREVMRAMGLLAEV